ncbi:putative modulator of DNA gyrase; TldD (chromatophore) [Paulinella micropora]|uniref:Modulator of DNA gyrase TldD n=1 Tax=Paulinella micropora TaxID=1928728 RepID=A0A1S6YJ83_9EUKA|nr:putative modulator of DNA gyrase [Paulinella micropora]BBL86574.1 putative modulator of DNA gyrase; TldD [Paulinella micropora]
MESNMKRNFDLYSGFDASWKQKLENLLAYGMAAGADLVEIFLERNDYIAALSEQGRISNTTSCFNSGAGLRIFKGGRDSFFSTNDLSTTGLRYALTKALSMLGLTIPDHNFSHFQGLFNLVDHGKMKMDWLNYCPSLSLGAQLILQASSHINQHSNHVHVWKSGFSRNWQEIMVAASDGTFARDIRLHQSTGLHVILVDRDYRSSISRRYGTANYPDDIYNWDSEASAEDLCHSAGSMLYARPVEGGQMPIVMSNRFGGVIFHEACGHLLETSQLERGTTPFADSICTQIAHTAVTAIDEGISKHAFGSYSIDDEGMEPQSIVLIEKGILKRFLSDRSGELLTGHPRTGSGRRQNYSYPSASRMRNTYIAPGPYTPSELIASVDKGLYCKSMGGGSVSPSGRFNFSVEEGYEIKNGQIGKPVKGATLGGEASIIMPRISMCANDLELAAGYCGSVSGNVCVTVGQPHIKVDSITVGGT